MNKNFIRIAVGTLAGIVLLTILMILLTTTPLMWAAYWWSIWAMVVFAIGLGFWSLGRRYKYMLHAAFVLVLKSYLTITLSIAFSFVLLECLGCGFLSWRWLSLIEFAVLAFTAWKLQAMDCARDAIEAVEEKVKISTIDWKMLTVEISAIEERAGSVDRPAIRKVTEAIRFADPVSHAAAEDISQTINGLVSELDIAVSAGDSGKIEKLCISIDQLVKERSNKLKLTK